MGTSKAALVHPGANVGRDCEIGAGVIILQRVTIGSSPRIGDRVAAQPASNLRDSTEVGSDAVAGSAASIESLARIEGASTVVRTTFAGEGATLC